MMLIVLTALMGLLVVKSGVLEMVKIELELRERRDREAALLQAISNGAPQANVYDGSVITLPASLAMTVEKRLAKELAVHMRQRLGKRVRVETPAGQVLAEAQ